MKDKEKIYKAIKEAVDETMESLGIEAFKRTSWFRKGRSRSSAGKNTALRTQRWRVRVLPRTHKYAISVGV